MYSQFERLLELSSLYGYHVSFVTNGMLFEERLPLLQRHRDMIEGLWFGLDGVDAQTHDRIRRTPGSFERVMRAIRSARSMGIQLGVNHVVTRENYQQIEQFLDLLRLEGITGAVIHRIVPHGRAKALALPQLEPAEALEVRRVFERRRDLVERLCTLANPFAWNGRGDGHCGHLSISTANVDWSGTLHPCSGSLAHPGYWSLPSIADRSLVACLGEITQIAREFQARRLEEYPLFRPGDPYTFCEYCVELWDAASAQG
jgi:MoaA/NifB/PqqE/SkfB family radical SAM enzyme